jgi:hypothetical protein
MDHTESANFVIFDTQASALFNRSCADMIQGAEPVCFLHLLVMLTLLGSFGGYHY